MRLIFSRDRAAQLDLLLRSLDANAPADHTAVYYRASESHDPAYEQVKAEHKEAVLARQYWFDTDLRDELSFSETVTFFCDDDVLYRPVPSLGADDLLDNSRILAFSLRLSNPTKDWPKDANARWLWTTFPPHDHGYPGSIDGHTFRTADVLRMIDGQTIENPLMLETILAHRCSMLAQERPLMACYPEQALVGVPVNSVADQAGRPHGERFPQPADELNARFLAGERIDLDALDFSGVDGCLHEVPFVWTQRVTA